MATEQSAGTATDTAPPGAAGMDPLGQLVLGSAPWIYQSLYVAARLGLADLLADGPRPTDVLATATGADAGTLYRFCRALAGLGVFQELPGRVFALTPMGEGLRDDAPGGVRHFLIVNSGASFQAWGQVMHSVRTGQPAFDHIFGMSYFDYLRQDAESNDSFNRMFRSSTLPAVMEDYDFGDDKVIVDVGGGMGALTADVLHRHSDARAILQDLPNGVERAPEYLAEQGLTDRVEIVEGSFFDGVPSGGDTYLLSRVLHDWGDQDALRILRRVRTSMPPAARLLVIDEIIPDVEGNHPSKFADLLMLVVLGGKERTIDELRDLLAQADFGVVGVTFPKSVHGPRTEALVEARPV